MSKALIVTGCSSAGCYRDKSDGEWFMTDIKGWSTLEVKENVGVCTLVNTTCLSIQPFASTKSLLLIKFADSG